MRRKLGDVLQEEAPGPRGHEDADDVEEERVDREAAAVAAAREPLACADIDRRFRGSPPNFGTLWLVRIDSADVWTNRWLSSRLRSAAEALASNPSQTLT